MNTLYDVTDQDGGFIMTAPLEMIRLFFRIHRDAEKRIALETENGGVCGLHFNGRNPNFDSITVKRSN